LIRFREGSEIVPGCGREQDWRSESGSLLWLQPGDLKGKH
jgi:hypothetical protein